MKTIKELIDKLKEIDETKYVILEGCDCWGNWDGEITVEKDKNYIVITRE